ncbi:expressed unknown protein [Seminavis robusta]|uniref:Uncharacterized protein n=1 Tax=Seminavis robusta TaxID=568900 RepID=A0A9N8DZ93_9STRA|nr:expressed unknown protein [Seminavis robusta]|eukprot:Sro494_g154330.1 n/a (263) ;mRNA; f:51637-52507
MFWEFGSSQVAPTEGAAEPLRDDVGDHSRDQEGDSRDEEKFDNHHNKQQNEHVSDVSMFSALTELLLNPFLDGYCQTPFCSDGDYLPPSCPAGRHYYTTPEYSKPHPDVPVPVVETHGSEEYGDICRSPSGASSGAGSHGKKRRQRPLALAVGYGHDWKDMDGRRVVITPSASRLSQYHHQQQHQSSPSYRPLTCTCTSPKSNNSLVLPESSNQNDSPHRTKPVMCKFCANNNRIRDLEVPPSHSSGTISSQSQKRTFGAYL